MVKKSFYNHLQSFRGLAALIIVLHHQKAISTSFITKNDFMMNSDLGVDFFFYIKWVCNIT